MKKILFIPLLMALLFNNISAKEIKEPQQSTHNFYTAVDEDLSDPQKNAINKVKELYVLMDAGKIEKFDDYCAKDFQIVNPVLPTPGNLETFKQLQLGFRAAFPDMLHEVVEIYSNGKSVVTKGVFKGTNTGSMMGNPPTGNRVELSFLVLDIMDSKGKIKMRTVQFDNKAFEAQLMKGINTSHSSINHNGMITAIGYGSLANPSTAVIMETYEKFGKGDVPAILLLCNENVLFDIQDHMFDTKARQFNGKAGVASFFTELSTKFKYNKFQPTRFVADGDDVFVTVDVAYTHLPSGKNYSTTYTHQFKVVNGKIMYFKGLDGYQQMQ